MWKTSSLGQASWTDSFGEISVGAAGGPYGISLQTLANSSVSICPVDGDVLPHACEQFVRGDQLHVNYSQGDSSYALRLVVDIVKSDADQLIIETCVSVQTDLLDSHPKLDIETDCLDIDSIVPADPYGKDTVAGAGSAPISVAKASDCQTSVLLSQQDHPFTTNHSTDMQLRLRLFGDFLEKGVIRRARPWLVFDRNSATSNEALEATWKQLCDSPLPLA